jgi:hypothetical protein
MNARNKHKLLTAHSQLVELEEPKGEGQASLLLERGNLSRSQSVVT